MGQPIGTADQVCSPQRIKKTVKQGLIPTRIQPTERWIKTNLIPISKRSAQSIPIPHNRAVQNPLVALSVCNRRQKLLGVLVLRNNNVLWLPEGAPCVLSGFLVQVQSVWVCTCLVFDPIFSVRGSALPAHRCLLYRQLTELVGEKCWSFLQLPWQLSSLIIEITFLYPVLNGAGGSRAEGNRGAGGEKNTLKMKNT